MLAMYPITFVRAPMLAKNYVIGLESIYVMQNDKIIIKI